MLKYLFFFIILTVIGIFYDRYKRRIELSEEVTNQKYIQKYLLNENTVFSEKKPMLWIHRKYEINARNWSSFLSRNSTDFNQPYIHLCVKSIIKKCSNSFNICLIDDDSFGKIIPGWNISIENLAEPIKSHMRTIAMNKLIYYYGGMILPNSTILVKDLHPLYLECLAEFGCFVGEAVNRTSTSVNTNFFPTTQIIGCKKNCLIIKQFIQYLETLSLDDYTNESDFLGQPNRWLHQQCITKKMTLIDGKVFGTKTLDNKPVYVDNLLSKGRIEFDDRVLHGIYIPADEVLKRTNYQWFARMSPEQVLQGDMIISKYILTCQ